MAVGKTHVLGPAHPESPKDSDGEERRVLKSVLFRQAAPLAQLDRASDYESEGREFESLRARHSFQSLTTNQVRTEALGPGIEKGAFYKYFSVGSFLKIALQ